MRCPKQDHRGQGQQWIFDRRLFVERLLNGMSIRFKSNIYLT
jgi:hypothetical protein